MNVRNKGVIIVYDVMEGCIKTEDDQIFEFDPSSYNELRVGDSVKFNGRIRGVLKEAWHIRKT